MRIELTRRADGATTLRCVRADGSVTWQVQRDPRHAVFFAHHDLTHYVVETELGVADGFFGLVAGGWELEDTSGKGARGPLPPGAVVVEHLVGALDREQSSPGPWPAAEFNAILAGAAARARAAPRTVSDVQLARMRARLAELLGRWGALAPGEPLVLDFPP